MFRKEYKKANDNIKVDEELLEKTLYTAFNGKQKKRVYSYRPMTSVAAAVVLVIGCGLAYPKLIDKPVIENTEPVITIAPVGDEILPVVEVVSTAAPKTTKTPEKKVLQTQKPVEVIISEPLPHVEESTPVVETEQGLPDTPSVARFIGEPVIEESIEEKLKSIEGYVLKESDNENYVFEGEDGKNFSIAINDTEETLDSVAVWEENGEGINLTFNKNDKVYVVKSQNISKEELTIIFNDFIN